MTPIAGPVLNRSSAVVPARSALAASASKFRNARLVSSRSRAQASASALAAVDPKATTAPRVTTAGHRIAAEQVPGGGYAVRRHSQSGAKPKGGAIIRPKGADMLNMKNEKSARWLAMAMLASMMVFATAEAQANA